MTWDKLEETISRVDKCVERESEELRHKFRSASEKMRKTKGR